MILQAFFLALRNLFAPETRTAFWKVLGLTLLLLVALWLTARQLLIWLPLPWLDSLIPQFPEAVGWVGFVFAIAASIGLALLFALLIAPVTAVIAGLFIDDVAEVIERRDYPNEPVGAEMPLIKGIWHSIKFFGVVIIGNIIALALLFVPGVNLIAFFVVNGYLLGREFFEFAAMRYRSPDDARSFRAKSRGQVFAAGLIIAGFLSIPIVNLLTPLFAASLMVHLHKALTQRDLRRLEALRR
jgi:CysZ protein